MSYGEWLSEINTSSINRETCGEKWSRLLVVDTARMIVEENRLWMLVFHNYASGYLNRDRLLLVSSATNRTSIIQQDVIEAFSKSGINEALLLLSNTLDSVCANVSQFKLAPSILKAMILVDAFNHGVVPGINQSLTCPSSYEGNKTSVTFYYYESPDIITTRDPATNMTYTKSILRGLYNSQYFFYFYSAFMTFVAGMLAIKLLMVQNEKRRYHMNKKVNHHHHQEGEELSETELKEMNITNIVEIGLNTDESSDRDVDLKNVEI
jgi:hypothetical protein